MTIPVASQEQEGTYQVSFVMPSKYTLATLPTPNNPKVNIRETRAPKVAVKSDIAFFSIYK